MSVTITTQLDMRHGVVPRVIRVSQYDSDFTLVFELFASDGDFTIESGTTAAIRGTKPSGTGYSAAATLNVAAKTITVTGDAQMTAVKGRCIYEVTLYKNNKELNSANFILQVENAALDANTITDASVLRELDAIIEGAATATQAAEDAEDAADRAEAAAQTLEIDPIPTQGSTNTVSSGGVYEALRNTDTTLTQPGQAADAAAVGRAIDAIQPGLSEDAKQALLACFAHVAWINANGQDYYDALEDALNRQSVSSYISATLALGNHVVYTTDSIESLRHFLTVEKHIEGGSASVVTNYTLSGSISTPGTKTITVTLDGMTTSFDVTVVSNQTGIIYEWDFTKGLIDFRQYKTAIPFSYENNSMTIDENGIHIDGYGERLELLAPDENTPISYFSNKTIQVDIDSYTPKPGNESYHTRFIMFHREQGSGTTNIWDSGLVYRKANTTASTEGWSIYAGSNGWGSRIDNMAREDISGHTVGMYLDTNLKPKIYLDSTIKSTQDKAFPSDGSIKGLSVGSTTGANTGGTLYDCTITGLRIYTGEVSA